ncbi:MAG: EFR1 family ferrodoxin [Spirochaetia bacterium]
MKKAVLYYSQSGNTRGAAEYFSNVTQGTELFSVRNSEVLEIGTFSCIGFFFPTYYLKAHPVILKAIENLPKGNGKPVFLVTTYGVMPGRSLRQAAKLLATKEYTVFESHALEMPESFPPFLKKGITSKEAPDPQALSEFHRFAGSVESGLSRFKKGNTLDKAIPKLSFLDIIIRPPSNKKIKKDFGRLFIDTDTCTKCGACISACPAGSLALKEGVEYRGEQCMSCFACYNRCPEGAIFTSKLDSGFQYSGNTKKFTGAA